MRDVLVMSTLLALAPARLVAQSGNVEILRGRVIDARTAVPLRDVGVVLTSGADTIARVRSDSTGAFQTSVSPTPFVVHFTRIGYRADSIANVVVGEFPLRVAMTSVNDVANTLATIVVHDSAARSGFERRARRSAGGAFIRAQDIEKRKPLRTSELFRAYPGVRIEDSSGVTQLFSARSTRQTAPTPRQIKVGDGTASIPSTNARACVLRVAVDGRLMPPDFSVDDVRPEDISGIELYLGAATIPTEFSTVQRDAPCGIIMLWTKTGI